MQDTAPLPAHLLRGLVLNNAPALGAACVACSAACGQQSSHKAGRPQGPPPQITAQLKPSESRALHATEICALLLKLLLHAARMPTAASCIVPAT